MLFSPKFLQLEGRKKEKKKKVNITKLLQDPSTVLSNRRALGILGTEDSLGVHDYLYLAMNPRACLSPSLGTCSAVPVMRRSAPGP